MKTNPATAMPALRLVWSSDWPRPANALLDPSTVKDYPNALLMADEPDRKRIKQ
jgi:hypothetical protein